MQVLVRFLKRVGVLIAGLIIAYIAVWHIFPIVDKQIPEDFVAIVITYLLTAYGLIPAILRLRRIILKPNHIPLYSTTPDGFACDPINIGLVGTREELSKAMQAAGWYEPDKRGVRSITKMILAIILRQSYITAPFSNLYLFGRKQDIGFELPITSTPRKRHHVRFWALTYTVDPRYREQVYFWQRHHRSQTPDRILWVGAASKDIGIRPIRHNAQLTHMIHPDTNAERDFIIEHLQANQQLLSKRTVQAGAPYRLRNRVLGGYMVADGELTIGELNQNR